jgi:thymidylate synthase
MEVIRGLGVNDLYYNGLELLRLRGQKEETRNGPALVYPTPVTTVYRDPRQRVLFDAKRNANPFFHLYESLWMLAGRYDANGLNVFVSNFGQRFAELGGTVHGAYGQRWRAALGYDQLAVIIKRLQDNPSDRQCVLQMWDATDKPEALAGYRGYKDLTGDWKDRPCNTHVYFRVIPETGALDMTILGCRSGKVHGVDRQARHT